uniref:Uncharacterized protein n=1 Tax=Anguilla anguilla TaxID=7936 RepID=A0A0E9Q8B3_ANGAN
MLFVVCTRCISINIMTFRI